jgi:hypothetical protein
VILRIKPDVVSRRNGGIPDPQEKYREILPNLTLLPEPELSFPSISEVVGSNFPYGAETQSTAQAALLWCLVSLRQKNGCSGAIGLGDNPNLAVSYAVGRKDSRALFEGSLVFLRVFAAEFAPVAAVAAVAAVDPIDRRLSLALKGSSGVPSKHGKKQRQETQGEDQQGQTYGEGKKGKKAQEEGEVGPPASLSLRTTAEFISTVPCRSSISRLLSPWWFRSRW